MKKKDKNLLLLAAAGGGAAYYFTRKKTPSVSGHYPGVGAMMPTASLVPAGLRGKCSPVYLDAALWGSLGTAAGYFLLAGKKL